MRFAALLFVFFVAIVNGIQAQESPSLKLRPLDDEKILKRLEDLENEKFKPLIHETDSLKNINDLYSMRIKDVSETNMAEMPMMEINKDIRYTMQIKKYTNYYGNFVNKDSLAQHKRRILPLKPKD